MNETITNDTQKIVLETHAERYLQELYARIPTRILQSYKGVYLRLEIKPDNKKPEYTVFTRDENWGFTTHYGASVEEAICDCLATIEKNDIQKAKMYRNLASEYSAKAEEYETKISGTIA